MNRIAPNHAGGSSFCEFCLRKLGQKARHRAARKTLGLRIVRAVEILNRLRGPTLITMAQRVNKEFKFLIIEDDENVRFLRRHELEKHFPECAIVECETAKEGISQSEKSTFDAIITDHKLPDESGAELIAQLRAKGVGCPIMMVTGSDDPSVHRKAYEAGATRVLFGARPNFVELLTTLLAAK